MSNSLSVNAPTLSVVVPCYNSGAALGQCLQALAQSEYEDFDVLVVDDGSVEPIKPIVERYGFRYARIQGPGGPARARNRGVAQVEGKYVVFVDADVCVHRDTLMRFAQVFAANPTVDAVIGSYDEEPADRSFLSQYKNLFHHYVHQKADGEINTFWSGCGAMRRDVFVAFGGFDEKRYRRPAIEDIELGTWMSAAGHKIILDSRIKGKHLKRWTLGSLFKTDIFDRGIPWTRLMLRAGKLANTLNVKSTQRLSVALVYLTLPLLLAAVQWPVALMGLAAVVATVTLLNLDFYRFFATRSGIWFTMRVFPLHWLYFWYCGFCFAYGAVAHYAENNSSGPLRRSGHPRSRRAT